MALGWACRDNGSSAASTLTRNGSRSPKRVWATGPSWPFQSAVKTSSSDTSPVAVSSQAGSPGWAPSHSSASGCAAGTGRPVNSAMAVLDPQA